MCKFNSKRLRVATSRPAILIATAGMGATMKTHPPDSVSSSTLLTGLSDKCLGSSMSGSVNDHKENKSDTRMSEMSSANCDNNKPMCQLCESINSREMFPIIKLLQWNNFSRRRRRKRPPQMNNWLQTTVVLLAICPLSVWSWSVPARQQAQSFYSQGSEDYYSGD